MNKQLAKILVNSHNFLQQCWEDTSDEDKHEFLNSDVILYHRSIGEALRNECLWKYTTGACNLFGQHVDFWSNRILKDFQDKKIKEVNKGGVKHEH